MTSLAFHSMHLPNPYCTTLSEPVPGVSSSDIEVLRYITPWWPKSS